MISLSVDGLTIYRTPVHRLPFLVGGHPGLTAMYTNLDVWKAAGSGTMTALFDTKNSFGQRVAMEVTKAKADAAAARK